MGRTLFFSIIFILLSGCRSSGPDLSRFATGNEGTWSVYEGTLPCADCSGIKARLELFNDKNNPEPPYIMKQAFLGTKDGDQAVIDHGIYRTEAGTFRGAPATFFLLDPDKEGKQRQFVRTAGDTLIPVDRNRNEVRSEQNHSLIRTATINER